MRGFLLFMTRLIVFSATAVWLAGFAWMIYFVGTTFYDNWKNRPSQAELDRRLAAEVEQIRRNYEASAAYREDEDSDEDSQFDDGCSAGMARFGEC